MGRVTVRAGDSARARWRSDKMYEITFCLDGHLTIVAALHPRTAQDPLSLLEWVRYHKAETLEIAKEQTREH